MQVLSVLLEWWAQKYWDRGTSFPLWIKCGLVSPEGMPQCYHFWHIHAWIIPPPYAFCSLPFPSIPAAVPTVCTHTLDPSHFKAGIFLNVFKGKIWSFLFSQQRKRNPNIYDFQTKSLLLGLTQNTIKKPLLILICWLVGIEMAGGRFAGEPGVNALGHHPVPGCFFRWFLLNGSSCCCWGGQFSTWP